jgi:hypothetical protein
MADESAVGIVEKPQAAELLEEKRMAIDVGKKPIVPEPARQTVVARGEVPAIGDPCPVPGRIAGRAEGVVRGNA